MKSSPALLLWLGVAPAAVSLTGCSTLLAPPPLENVPQRLKLPKGEQFDPANYVVHGTRQPDSYRVVGVNSGTLITVQAVYKAGAASSAKGSAPAGGTAPRLKSAPGATPPGLPTGSSGSGLVGADSSAGGPLQLPAGNAVATSAKAPSVRPSPTVPTPTSQPAETYGAPEVVHLEGIVTPQKGQPGYSETVSTIYTWTTGINVNRESLALEVDDKFPWDSANRRMVQLYFTPTTGAYSGREMNLNRMLVRSGFAIVDLYQATAVDLQAWLNDEVYARNHRTPAGVPAPLGLVKMGILLGQRPPPPPAGTDLPGAATANATSGSATGKPTAIASGSPNSPVGASGPPPMGAMPSPMGATPAPSPGPAKP